MEKSLPIATYRERIHCLIDRKFELYADRVRVHGNSRGMRFDSNINVSDLAGLPNRVWLRSQHFHWATKSVAILSVFIFLPFVARPPMWCLFFGIAAFLSALIYLILNLKRYEYLQYKNSVGLVILDIGKAGPEIESFSQFSLALDEAIDTATKNRDHPKVRSAL